MSMPSDENKNSPYKPLLTASEIYSILLFRLEALKQKLSYHAVEVDNTQVTDSWKDVQDRVKGPEALSYFKAKVYEAMQTDVQNSSASAGCSLDGCLEATLIRRLKEHGERNSVTIYLMKENLTSIKKILNITTLRRQELETILQEKQAIQNKSDKELSEELKKKEELVSLKHRKLVRGVRSVTSLGFPERRRDLDGILGALLEASLNGDGYIAVEKEENCEELVEFLLRTGMVTRHPINPKLIRLMDFF